MNYNVMAKVVEDTGRLACNTKAKLMAKIQYPTSRRCLEIIKEHSEKQRIEIILCLKNVKIMSSDPVYNATTLLCTFWIRQRYRLTSLNFQGAKQFEEFTGINMNKFQNILEPRNLIKDQELQMRATEDAFIHSLERKGCNSIYCC